MKKYLYVAGVIFAVSLLGSWGWGRSSARLMAWVARLEATRAANGDSAVEPMQPPAGTEAVNWANVTNCTLTGRTLRKTRGSNELSDAGANSTQTIGGKGSAKVNGFVEFRASENNKERYLGLTNDFAGTSPATIDFAIHLSSIPYRGMSVAEVRENDVYKAEIGYQPNDIFRIAVEDGAIKYYHNGAMFYSSANKPSYPLVMDCAFLHLGSSVSDVVIAANNAARTAVSSDNTPPDLSNFNETTSPGGTTLISWNTDEPATAQLEYGLTPSYGNVLALNTSGTSHRASLNGLIRDTVYHYRINARDAAGNLVVSPDRTFSTALNAAIPMANPVGNTMAGVLDKDQILIPANYTTFTPPPAGGQYVDSIFGTTVIRLGDGWKQFKDSITHEYATMSPFNRDDSLILLQSNQTGFFVVDQKGKVIARPELSNSAEPRWSHTENDVFYYHDDNRLMKYKIATTVATTVANFPQFERITFGGGECDISEDGDHLMIAGDMRHVGVFTLSAGKLGRTIDLTALTPWAEVYLTANNNVAVRWEEEGEGKYQGLGLFDGNMNFIRKVLPFGAHSDQARDVNGDEVIVMGAYRDLKPPPGCENSGVEKVRLSDSKKTCILAIPWYQETHVSTNSNGKHHWVLISTTDGKGTADLPGKLPADWQRHWRPRDNELILMKVDGSERRRIVHHRSRVAEFYFWQPRAALSKDGRFAIFDSNFGFNPIKDYVDPYLVNLTK